MAAKRHRKRCQQYSFSISPVFFPQLHSECSIITTRPVKLVRFFPIENTEKKPRKILFQFLTQEQEQNIFLIKTSFMFFITIFLPLPMFEISLYPTLITSSYFLISTFSIHLSLSLSLSLLISDVLPFFTDSLPLPI